MDTSSRRDTTPQRVLVIEDERNIRYLMSVVLTQLGYDVLEADGGPEALAILQQTPDIAAIVSDLWMPGTDIVAFLDEVKQTYPHIPIIITSAYVTSDWAAPALRKGVSYLHKPFTWEQLVSKIRAATYQPRQQHN